MNKAGGGGISFMGLLTIVFIVLKLTNHIAWSWIWVLAPTWIPLAILMLILVGCGIVLGGFWLYGRLKASKED